MALCTLHWGSPLRVNSPRLHRRRVCDDFRCAPESGPTFSLEALGPDIQQQNRTQLSTFSGPIQSWLNAEYEDDETRESDEG